MERVLKKISDISGNALPLACAIVIAVLLISSVIMEYIRLNIIADGVRNALQASIISVSTGNYDEVYNGLREGYSGGYKRSGGSWDEWLDEGDIYAELDSLLGLNSSHEKISRGKIEYSLVDLKVNIKNSPFAPTNPIFMGKFEAEAKITIEVPLSFGWNAIPPLKLIINTTAGYTPKF